MSFLTVSRDGFYNVVHNKTTLDAHGIGTDGYKVLLPKLLVNLQIISFCSALDLWLDIICWFVKWHTHRKEIHERSKQKG